MELLLGIFFVLIFLAGAKSILGFFSDLVFPPMDRSPEANLHEEIQNLRHRLDFQSRKQDELESQIQALHKDLRNIAATSRPDSPSPSPETPLPQPIVRAAEAVSKMWPEQAATITAEPSSIDNFPEEGPPPPSGPPIDLPPIPSPWSGAKVFPASPISQPVDLPPLPPLSAKSANTHPTENSTSSEELIEEVLADSQPVQSSPTLEYDPFGFLKNVDWESFLGVKMFAWLGGLALFLGMSFFIKYSVDNNLISPQARFYIGLLVGIGALVGGLELRRRTGEVYEFTVHALCASGVAILYSDIIAARVLLEYTSITITFLLMVSVTATAFLLSVQLSARFVAILGLLGGFLTPPILSTGHDNPIGLFLYIAVLNTGLVAVALRKQWGFLVTLGAIGTGLMQIGWYHRFFLPEKILIGWSVFLFFPLFFAGARQVALKRFSYDDLSMSLTSCWFPVVTMWFSAALLKSWQMNGFESALFSLQFVLAAIVLLQAPTDNQAQAPLGFSLSFSVLFLVLWGLAAPFHSFLNPALILIAFPALYVTVWARNRQNEETAWTLQLPAGVHSLVALGLAFNFFVQSAWIIDPLPVFALMYLILGGVAVFSLLESTPSYWLILGELLSFGLIAQWTLGQARLGLDSSLLRYLIFLSIPAFHVLLHFLSRRRNLPQPVIESSYHLAPILSMAFAGILLLHPATSSQAGSVFAFLAVLNLLSGWQVLHAESAQPYYHAGGVGNFILIWIWAWFHPGPEHFLFTSCLFTGFGLYYLIIGELAPRFPAAHPTIRVPAACFPLFAFSFIYFLLDRHDPALIPQNPLWLLLVLDSLIAFQAVRDDQARPLHFIGGIASFLLLMQWNQGYLTNEALPWGLFFFAVFAISHAAVPVILQKLRPESSQYLWGHLFPPLMLLLMVFPIFKGMAFSFFLWPIIILINLVGLFAAWFMAWIWAGLTFLLISTGLVALCIHRLADSSHLSHLLIVEFGFSLLFHVWGVFVWRNRDKFVFQALGWAEGLKSLFSPLDVPTPESRTGSETPPAAWELDPLNLAVLPSLSSLFPFILVLFTLQRLPMPSPDLIFLFCLGVSLLLLRLCKDAGTDATALIALFSVGLVELSWHQMNFIPTEAHRPMLWFVGFWFLFLAFPFVFQSRVQNRVIPWITAALAGPLQFYFLHSTFMAVFGPSLPGILPALMALPYLYGLKRLTQDETLPEPIRIQLQAWFGGTALFFITLIFPIQFDREWLTIGWALLGSALLWLYHRVPHEGLKGWGISLLLISFARLANPAIFDYYPRQATPVFNWFLYAFGVTTASLIAGANLLRPPRQEWLGYNIQKVLYILGGILAFFLLNIEIADYYSSGNTIVFQFSGAALERNTAYSVGWSIFAFTLLVIGIWSNSRGARLGSVGLLTFTIFKVFLWDLWSLGGLYRVGSLVGLSGALLMVSFLYQKFVTIRPSSQSPVSREPS